MLSKEEVLEIISYCDFHKINRSARLQELGISQWNFYKSRRHHLKAEKSCPQDNMGMTADERRELRQKEAYPVIQLMERWCVYTYSSVLESSLLGKAIAYTYSLMDRLAVYVNDGRINIDNNLIENAIRPLALGRKNWFFCGNDASAYRAAIVYSLLASCRAADVDPRQWLEHVLVEIPSRRKSGQPMDDLLPLEYTQRPEFRPWNLPDPD